MNINVRKLLIASTMSGLRVGKLGGTEAGIGLDKPKSLILVYLILYKLWSATKRGARGWAK